MQSDQRDQALLVTADSSEDLFLSIEAYEWEKDTEFQKGLQSILASSSSAGQAEHVRLRAQCYYFARKRGVQIDFAEYSRWRESRQPTAALATTSPSTQANAVSPRIQHDPEDLQTPYPMSFGHIVELISTGQAVPGIKQIPDTVLEGQDTKPAVDRRPKPWEQQRAPSGDF